MTASLPGGQGSSAAAAHTSCCFAFRVGWRDVGVVRFGVAGCAFAALLLAAASVAKIRAFLHTAETDSNGDRWVEREPLVSALRTPPGDAAPDPPPEEEPAVA